MSFADSVAACLGKYADFSGRARRSELWWFVLFCLLLDLGGTVADEVLGISWGGGFGPVSTLLGLAVLVPSLAVGARRLHDTGRSGWWQALVLVPVLGFVAIVVLFCLDGDKAENRYGAPVS